MKKIVLTITTALMFGTALPIHASDQTVVVNSSGYIFRFDKSSVYFINIDRDTKKSNLVVLPDGGYVILSRPQQIYNQPLTDCIQLETAAIHHISLTQNSKHRFFGPIYALPSVATSNSYVRKIIIAGKNASDTRNSYYKVLVPPHNYDYWGEYTMASSTIMISPFNNRDQDVEIRYRLNPNTEIYLSLSASSNCLIEELHNVIAASVNYFISRMQNE